MCVYKILNIKIFGSFMNVKNSKKSKLFYPIISTRSVRHVTGNDEDYLRKIPRVVW